MQAQFILESASGISEQRLEDVAHREHGRAGVDRSALWREAAQLAADIRRSFDECDVMAAAREVDARGEATYACADHDGALFRSQAFCGRCRVMA